MIRIRSFSDQYPLTRLDVLTGSNRVAAGDAAERAEHYGTWDAVQIDFQDGSRPLRGEELERWVRRHYPEEIRG